LVGIGTSNPTNGKVEIRGERDNTFSYAYYATNGSSTRTGYVSNGGQDYSLYATHRVAASEFNAHSDRRIKRVIGRSNSRQDLNQLLAIRVTDYTYTDTVAHDSEEKTKVIAQQLEEVYPRAVSSHTTEIVPDIYRNASIANGWVQLADHNVKTGDKVQLITDEGKSLHKVQKTKEGSFQVDGSHEGNVFVYGRQVEDFHTVDYQALTTLNISATQALYREKETLKTRVDSLSKQLESLKNKVEKLTKQGAYRASNR
jgi:hypothetical protein